MARVTKADLEADNEELRRHLRRTRVELDQVRSVGKMYEIQYSMMLKYLSTMSIAVERVSDALAHSIGHVTDPNRAKHIQNIADKVYEEKYRPQEPDTRTFIDLHEADKERQ